MERDLELAVAELKREGCSLAVARDNKLLFTSQKSGVAGLLEALDRELLQGSALADKVIGRAAAMIAVAGGVQSVYTPLISAGAQQALQQAGLDFIAEKTVPGIINRQGSGPCPMEEATQGIDDPPTAVAAVRSRLAELMGK